MAFSLETGPSEVKVILRKDSAVTCSDKEYMEYLESFKTKTPDEDLLKLSEEPTRFVFRTGLSWEHEKKLQGDNMKVRGKEMDINPYYAKDIVRMSLKSIDNPPQVDPAKHIKFQKDNDGFMKRDFFMQLQKMGEFDHMTLALMNYRRGPKSDEQTEADEEIEKN